MRGRGACMAGKCMAGGMCGECALEEGMHSRGTCLVGGRGHAWQEYAWQGACMAGGNVWQGVSMAGGKCGRGAVHGRGNVWQGACRAGGCVWQEIRPLQWVVRILLECILV